jgi:hypothetical protein
MEKKKKEGKLVEEGKNWGRCASGKPKKSSMGSLFIIIIFFFF